MKYRRLGKSGLQLSVFSFGSWVTFSRQVDRGLAVDLMALAYEHGINFFDNAEVYEDGNSEKLMGEALAKLNWPRDTYCVSSKVYWGGDKPTQRGLSRKHVIEACHAALRRLQVEYLDLYFCHRPDVETPIEETVRAMHDLVSQGKVMYWGTSEWNARQITEAFAVARELRITPPTMEQPHYNLFTRDKMDGEYLPLFEQYGLGTTTWSPLSSGLLTGKYSGGIAEGTRLSLAGYEWLRDRYEGAEGAALSKKINLLQELADTAGIPLAHLALLWCLENPHVSTVILGASKLDQLQQNLESLDNTDKMTDELLISVENILQNKPEPEQRF
jgi:voltage-dependent potassium channel beta subunit